ncbi:hypothetical protein [Schaalia dentiphila]|nr:MULTISPECIES: hypothetical protein [Schaalia]
MMSDLSFVAGEFPKLAATSRETADAVRSARPEGGASAFASAMPGANLASPMQAVEEKVADQCVKTSMKLEEHADALEAAERDFIAAEEENGQLIGSIINGDDCGHSGPGGGGDSRKNPRLVPLPSPISGGNPPQRGPRLPGDPGKQRGGHHPGEGTRGHRRPNPGTGRPKVEPMPFDPVMPISPIVTGPRGPHPLPKPAIELPKVPPIPRPTMGNPTPMVDPIEPRNLGFNRFSAELGG